MNEQETAADTDRKAIAEFLQVPIDAPSIAIAEACERRLQLLAPCCFRNRWLHVLCTSQLPDSLQIISRGTGGTFHADGYHIYKQYLRADRGVGPMLLINDIADVVDIRERCRAELRKYPDVAHIGEDVLLKSILTVSFPIVAARLSAITHVFDVAVHELCHAVDDITEPDDEFDCRLECAEIMARRKPTYVQDRRNELVTRRREQVELDPQHEAHGLKFTRIYCHLVERLKRFGVSLVPAHCADSLYHQKPFADCQHALRHELPSTWDHNFVEIVEAPMPAEFERCLLPSARPAGAVETVTAVDSAAPEMVSG